MRLIQTRRQLLTSVTAVGAVGLLGGRPVLADEPPPETTAVRLYTQSGVCTAPPYVAEELLRAEGFVDIHYVPAPVAPAQFIGQGEVDFGLSMAQSIVFHRDAGLPVMALAGVHPGCWELFAHPPIQTISDLKRRTVGIPDGLGSSGHLFVAIMVAQVGLDPNHDIDWVPGDDAIELFAQGKINSLLLSLPDSEDLRSRNVGRVILNTTTDSPWSNYFCCMFAGNEHYVRQYPAATKRVLRAILKATELCAAEPERVAQRLIENGFTTNYDYAVRSLRQLPYQNWRELEPEDSLRFYALRLYEVGMITSTPNKIIAEGTDWRFLNELKRELKA